MKGHTSGEESIVKAYERIKPNFNTLDEEVTTFNKNINGQENQRGPIVKDQLL